MRSAKARRVGMRPVLPQGPSGIGCVPSPLVGVPSGTSKTDKSLLLAVSRVGNKFGLASVFIGRATSSVFYER